MDMDIQVQSRPKSLNEGDGTAQGSRDALLPGAATLPGEQRAQKQPQHGVHAGNIDAVNNSQADKMRASYAADQPAVMALYAEVHAILKETLLAWAAQYVELQKP